MVVPDASRSRHVAFLKQSKTVHRRFQILRRLLTDVANELRDRGALDEEECFIDATFVMPRVADRQGLDHAAAKAPLITS